METLILTYPETKKQLLKDRKQLSSNQIMSMQEFLNKLLFHYDEKAIYYMMKTYHLKYDVAVVYLKNFVILLETDSTLYQDKIHDLLQKKLLERDTLFVQNIKNKKLKIYDYPLSIFEKYILKKYQCNYELELNPIQQKDYKIHVFDTVEEEINFVAISIIELLKQGVDVNRIKLMNVSDEYQTCLKRVFKFYHLPLEEKYTLYGKKEVIDFVTKLKNSKDISLSLNQIEEKSIQKKVIKILNQYSFVKQVDDLLIEIIVSELKKEQICLNKLVNKVEITEQPSSNDIVFLLGFNDAFPRYFKDEEFLSDRMKKDYNIDTSIEKNVLLEEQNLRKMSKPEKIYLTYSKKIKNDVFQLSPLSEKINYTLKSDFQDSFYYSNLYNKIKLAKMLDEKNKFNITSPHLSILYHHYPAIDYQKYNNEFTGIPALKLYQYLDNKLILSYSSIDNFYKCKFKFYLNNILKITPFEETFAIKIGNIFHHILEKCNRENFNYEQSFIEELSNMEFNSMERVFLKKLKSDLKFIIDVIQKQNHFSRLTEEEHEKRIYVNKDKTISITFMGVIDKVKYTEQDGNIYLAIIDYKTGNPITNLTKTFYGLDMQLPIYLYLLHNSNQFKNAEVVGIYLQKILNNELAYNPKKDYWKQKEEQLKLEGYSIDNPELISLFDTTYQDSEIIKGMKTSKNGFYAYTKIITKKQMENLYRLVEKNIDTAIDDILKADFKINPKKFDMENTCKFCPYSDICYKKEENYEEIKIPKNLDFLNEVEHAKVD